MGIWVKGLANLGFRFKVTTSSSTALFWSAVGEPRIAPVWSILWFAAAWTWYVLSFSFLLVSRVSIRSQLTCFCLGWCWQSDDESVEVRDQEAQDQLRDLLKKTRAFPRWLCGMVGVVVVGILSLSRRRILWCWMVQGKTEDLDYLCPRPICIMATSSHLLSFVLGHSIVL
jgi:hypothetical protein